MARHANITAQMDAQGLYATVLIIANMVANTVTGTEIATGNARTIAPPVIKSPGRVCDAFLPDIMAVDVIRPAIITESIYLVI